jgi:hypothetical protein
MVERLLRNSRDALPRKSGSSRSASFTFLLFIDESFYFFISYKCFSFAVAPHPNPVRPGPRQRLRLRSCDRWRRVFRSSPLSAVESCRRRTFADARARGRPGRARGRAPGRGGPSPLLCRGSFSKRIALRRSSPHAVRGILRCVALNRGRGNGNGRDSASTPLFSAEPRRRGHPLRALASSVRRGPAGEGTPRRLPAGPAVRGGSLSARDPKQSKTAARPTHGFTSRSGASARKAARPSRRPSAFGATGSSSGGGVGPLGTQTQTVLTGSMRPLSPRGLCLALCALPMELIRRNRGTSRGADEHF